MLAIRTLRLLTAPCRRQAASALREAHRLGFRTEVARPCAGELLKLADGIVLPLSTQAQWGDFWRAAVAARKTGVRIIARTEVPDGGLAPQVGALVAIAAPDAWEVHLSNAGDVEQFARDHAAALAGGYEVLITVGNSPRRRRERRYHYLD